MAFVIAAGASSDSGLTQDVAADIGSGTSRKAFLAIGFQDTDNDRTLTVSYDPAGTNQTPTQIGTTQSESDDGTPHKFACYYYDIPDGQSGSKTFRAVVSGIGTVRINHVVAIYDSAATGALEAGPIWEAVPAPTGGTTISDSITTVAANATIVQMTMIHGGADGDETFVAPNNGQTERIEEAFETRFHVSVMDLVKATGGAQTIGLTADATFNLAIQGLVSFAPAAAAGDTRRYAMYFVG